MSALPTTAMGHLRPGGGRVEIQGVVANPEQPLISPFFQRPCLSYRLKIFVSSAQYRKTEGPQGWVGGWEIGKQKIAERADHQEIQLADSTGRAWIQFGDSDDNTNPFDLSQDAQPKSIESSEQIMPDVRTMRVRFEKAFGGGWVQSGTPSYHVTPGSQPAQTEQPAVASSTDSNEHRPANDPPATSSPQDEPEESEEEHSLFNLWDDLPTFLKPPEDSFFRRKPPKPEQKPETPVEPVVEPQIDDSSQEPVNSASPIPLERLLEIFPEHRGVIEQFNGNPEQIYQLDKLPSPPSFWFEICEEITEPGAAMYVIGNATMWSDGTIGVVANDPKDIAMLGNEQTVLQQRNNVPGWCFPIFALMVLGVVAFLVYLIEKFST